LAIIVENDLIQASLAQRLGEYSNLKVFFSNQIVDFDDKEQHIELKLANKSKIFTKLLIGADGANSFVRQKAKFSTTKWDHDQIAINSTLKLAQV
jgi:2-octaprenyl-3-methyl-6-methoxy-1,4-benzoquinol hydroxylase